MSDRVRQAYVNWAFLQQKTTVEDVTFARELQSQLDDLLSEFDEDELQQWEDLTQRPIIHRRDD